MAVIRTLSCFALLVLLQQAAGTSCEHECDGDLETVSLLQTAMTHKVTSDAWNHVMAETTKRHRVLRSPSTPDEFDANVVAQGCGEICDTSQPAQHSSQGRKYFDMIEKPVDCMALYQNTESDAPAATWPPPRDLPDSLHRLYTMNGEAKSDDWYLQDKYSGGEALVPVWTTKLIDQYIAAARAGLPDGNYALANRKQIHALLQQNAADIRGKHMTVIGSESPWLESLLLEVGARHVTTIEYGEIRSEDPRISTMTPDEVRRLFLASNGTQPRFDGGATFSSVEHSGLGRYGDRLNPWGDLQAMAKAWCMIKAQGPMFVGVPTNKFDFVHYNAHRVYGPKRYSHLMANFVQIDNQGPSPFDRECIENGVTYGLKKDWECEPQVMIAFARGNDKLAQP